MIPPVPPALRPRIRSDASTLDACARASGPFSLRPRAVVRPLDADEVAQTVSWAAEADVGLVPRGAGTGMPGGNVGRDVVLDLTALDRVQADPDDADHVWVGPGVVAARLEAWAQERGRFFPALPSSAQRCTLGGMVANNAAGARSFAYGAVHAWIAAIEAVTADGRPVRLHAGVPPPPPFDALHARLAPAGAAVRSAWPDVRKNSSGYALDRFLPEGDAVGLMVGSEGTLAVVTRIRVRLAPRPARRSVALLPVPREADLMEAVGAATEAGAAACEFLGRRFLDVAGLRADPWVGPALAEAGAALLIELDDRGRPPEDGREVLARCARSLGTVLVEAAEAEARERLWRVRHAASPAIAAQAADGLVSMQFIEDSVVPPTALGAYLVGLGGILAEEETDAVIFGHAGDGNVHVNPLIDVRRTDWRDRVGRILHATAHLVAGLGGTLSGEHGDGRVRTPYNPTVWGADVMEAFRTVKEALDPRSTLNPGVVIPCSGQDPLEGLSAEGGR